MESHAVTSLVIVLVGAFFNPDFAASVQTGIHSCRRCGNYCRINHRENGI